MVEQLCVPCFMERLHEERAGMLVCRTCGTVTEVINSNGNAGKIGVGVSGRGGSGEGVKQPSLPTSAYATSAYAEMLHGDDLAALDGDHKFARFLCEKAGLEFLEDEPQEIVIGETAIVVRIWVDDHQAYVIRPVSEDKVPTFPGTSIRALKLGQFYASVCAGRLIRPTGAALARWKRRGLLEWGVIGAPPVCIRPLPDDAPLYIAPVWEGIRLLLAVRRLTEPDGMVVPLARDFVRDWCGRDGKEVRRALGWLDRHGWIWRVCRTDVGKPKPMTLWAVAEELGP